MAEAIGTATTATSTGTTTLTNVTLRLLKKMSFGSVWTQNRKTNLNDEFLEMYWRQRQEVRVHSIG